MKIIGIVGGMGAGKSTVVHLITEMSDVNIIYADKIGHDVLLKGHEAYDEVVQEFGTDILDDNKEIVRHKLGSIVFGDAAKVEKLNSITHPKIIQIIKSEIERCRENYPNKNLILEAALLIESGLVDMTDVVIGVYTDKSLRVDRVKNRDGLDETNILDRFERQLTWDEKKKYVNYEVDNSKDLVLTRARVKEILSQIDLQ